MIQTISTNTTQLELTCNRVSQVKKQQKKPTCNPYPMLSLRGPATPHLQNEARSA